jgi:hypothetical protein
LIFFFDKASGHEDINILRKLKSKIRGKLT